MVDILAYFLACIVGLALTAFFHLRWRPFIWGILGFIFLFLFSLASVPFLIFVVLQSVLVGNLVAKLDRNNFWRKYLPYIILLNMFWVDFHKVLVGNFVDTVGVSFAVIRIFMTCKHIVSSRKNLTNELFQWNFAAGFYLPAIMVGPVFSGLDLRKEAKGKDKLKGPPSYLYRNLFWGLSLSLLFTVLATEVAVKEHYVIQSYPIQATLLFLNLFAAFWGQSLIAEMTSKISGISIPANFDKPWLATDIKEFWQRWHMSMSRFIMQFIFFPLQINKFNPKLATVVAFVFMGLWHEVKLGYFLWGIAHGALMAFWPERPADAPKLRIWIERILTFTFVINLSYLANYALKG